MGGTPELDRSEAADARRLRWLLDGHGYFLEEESLCGHGSGDEDAARRAIDSRMSDTLFRRPTPEELKGMEVLADSPSSFVAIKRETVDWPTHPVDVVERIASELDLELDPERVAEMRAICDERVSRPGHWSTSPPTEPGFYLCRQRESETPREYPSIVKISEDGPFYYDDHDPRDGPIEYWSEGIAEPPA